MFVPLGQPLVNGPPSRENPLLAAALDYRQRGWSIIPTVGKKSGVPWKRFQTERAGEDTIRRWFADGRATGVAVVLGNASGGLAVRDYDTIPAFDSWADANPADAASLPTARTARGFHIFGVVDREIFVNMGDGELRGTCGLYVLTPPSRHPSGTYYEWVNPLPPVGVLLPQLPASLLRDDFHNAEKNLAENPAGGNNTSSTTQASSSQLKPAHAITTACASLLEQAISETLPTGPGQRNRKLFDLARLLKGMMPQATPDELRGIVGEWHRQALPHILTKPFSNCWTDFVIGWQRVEKPANATFAAACREADRMPPPAAADRYDTPAMHELIRLCAALQRVSGERAFFLGCREAGAYLGVSPKAAWAMLRTLAFDGVLELVRKGTRARGDKKGRASEWHFVRTENEGETHENAAKTGEKARA